MSATLVGYVERHKLWSEANIGLGLRTEGILAHIAKECEEIRAKPTDTEEWADIVILGLDGAWRSAQARMPEATGFGIAQAVAKAVYGKMRKVWQRRYPKGVPADQPCEHLR